ncbi:MAG: hypothetical protein ACYTFK_00345 [Planctomycetota bacterium]|jgi:hypothetical protein
MSERVNCNILQPSTLARRTPFVTGQSHPAHDNHKTGKDRRKTSKAKEAHYTVNVSRKWHSAKNTVRSILDMYKWLETAPLGLFVDVWA